MGTLPPCDTHNTNHPGVFQVQHGDVAERGRDEVRHGEHGQNCSAPNLCQTVIKQYRCQKFIIYYIILHEAIERLTLTLLDIFIGGFSKQNSKIFSHSELFWKFKSLF